MVLNHLSPDPDVALQQVNDVGDRILESVAKPLETLSSEKDLSTSVGVVLYRDENISAGELMRMADIAMYDAKRKGKNCLSIFDNQMQQDLLAKEKLTVELREALLRGKEIVPWFQRKVNENSQITGFEALVRWEHPVHGVMNPGQFLALAEGNNMIVALGDQVLLKSCEFMSAMRNEFSINDLSISVNVSQKQLAMPDFPEKVENVLSNTGLPGHMLTLEITESVVAENIQQSIERMERLKCLGVKFSLDDFGTGYSSLSYLRRLPIDEVKIDRSFVENLLMDEEGYAMVRSILHMANSLNLSVVAEGIERDEQWQTLKELGCKAFQGYLFGHPKSLQDTREVMIKGIS
jgi:EAL domain-containing protein (putative c-di-GMP-specific phosphodiesterase class I)